ncbi:MAG: phosphoadenosine phosphosulfate reductase family protein [Oscillospiraceae bacterium]|nr:phosphoadenosine phosphosulfate reductase family protein [Oscillospiraceae bacterium]
MWCVNCNKETVKNICDICNSETIKIDERIPVIYWCDECKIPLIKLQDTETQNICPICNNKSSYLCTDLRPVFPEERLLLEIIKGCPLEYKNKSVWAMNNRYYIDGKTLTISKTEYQQADTDKIIRDLSEYKKLNDYKFFDKYISKFIKANSDRLSTIFNEASNFIQKTSQNYPEENIVISFSGGKDSTVTADLVMRALSNPSMVHIFGNTTLEFPTTIEYAKRYRENQPFSIFRIAKNNEQDFYSVCNDIGAPARMLRWCCTMFKTGPITRVLNSLYPETDILTFYGIRKCESVSRSKYNRVEDNSESVKIQKQKVASPIFLWKDIDIWLYILGEEVDFNYAYRLGYDRVGCWCCPNNSSRAEFLSKIYMTEEYNQWHNFLVDFAQKIGKPDPEVYVDTGAWKARQGGNGVKAAQDVKIKFTNCTTEDNAKVFQLNRPVDETFTELFIPFGKIAPELGRKLIKETIIIDITTNVPIISIQPFNQENFEYSVKIKVMNVEKPDDLLRMAGYQVKKYNACRKCLKCESICKFRAISIVGGEYHINSQRCKRCKMCVTSKYLEGGCLMEKYLKTKV